MQLSLLKVRKLQPKDWEACWKIQRSLHTEPDENLFDAHTWSFICDVMSDSFVVADENDYAIAYWLGFLKVNDIEETPDVCCFALDVCTHRDYRKQGIMDLIMPVVTQYHPRIFAFTKEDNSPAQNIMTKWGFNKGEYYPKIRSHYWTYENIT